MAISRLRTNEATTREVTIPLVDGAGVAVPLVDIATAQLTLYDLDVYVPGGSPNTGIINSRDAQDVLNTNNVVIPATSGLVVWTMQPDDNKKPTGLSEAQDNYLKRKQIWRHRVEFRFVTTAGAELDYQFEVEVVNLRKAS